MFRLYKTTTIILRVSGTECTASIVQDNNHYASCFRYWMYSISCTRQQPLSFVFEVLNVQLRLYKTTTIILRVWGTDCTASIVQDNHYSSCLRYWMYSFDCTRQQPLSFVFDLNFLEPSGPFQACKGLLYFIYYRCIYWYRDGKMSLPRCVVSSF